MDQRSRPSAPTLESTSRFDLAPPRRFVLPAVLLLILEEPDVGYSLAHRLIELGVDHVDRPAVYRALARLEADGLVTGVAERHGARAARRYRVTEAGRRALRRWMGVIKEEHDQLGRVLRRYQGTATGDALLAEVEGSWSAEVGYGWSALAPTWDGLHRSGGWDGAAAPAGPAGPGPPAEPPTTKSGRYGLVAERSVVLVEVRSTAGPLSFGAIGVTGTITAAVGDGRVLADPAPGAVLEVDVSALRSGNRLYDAELLRRIEAHRYPKATAELRSCELPGDAGIYHLRGALTFHGRTRPADGVVRVETMSDQRLVVTGHQDIDVRDFAIPCPTVLMLRIYPDVRVHLHVEAELEEVL